MWRWELGWKQNSLQVFFNINLTRCKNNHSFPFCFKLVWMFVTFCNCMQLHLFFLFFFKCSWLKLLKSMIDHTFTMLENMVVFSNTFLVWTPLLEWVLRGKWLLFLLWIKNRFIWRPKLRIKNPKYDWNVKDFCLNIFLDQFKSILPFLVCFLNFISNNSNWGLFSPIRV
jgi:hypothetical protein